MAKQGLKKASKIVAAVIVLIVLIALIVGIMYVTRFGKENFKTFILKIDNRYVLRNENNITLYGGEKFTIKSTSDYSVSIYAYSEYEDFEFEYDGKVVKWSDFSEVDFLTRAESGLKIDKQADGFIFEHTPFEKVISTEKSVEIPEAVKQREFDRLRMIITSNGSEISISFRISVEPAGAKITPDKIIF